MKIDNPRSVLGEPLGTDGGQKFWIEVADPDLRVDLTLQFREFAGEDLKGYFNPHNPDGVEIGKLYALDTPTLIADKQKELIGSVDGLFDLGNSGTHTEITDIGLIFLKEVVDPILISDPNVMQLLDPEFLGEVESAGGYPEHTYLTFGTHLKAMYS